MSVSAGARPGTGRHVHVLGICGYAVSGAALVARELGYTVSGSDEEAYPPITDVITAAGIPWVNHHEAANLDRFGTPDLCIVGNQVRPGNPEFDALVERGLPYTSESEFYAELTQDRLRLTVTGTHGKTTTASLLAVMLERAGMEPGFRLGTTSRDFDATARLGGGAGTPFVFEGDEYTTSLWDRRPKFLHTHPRHACVTNLELDHPDVFADLDAYRAPFALLAQAMPADGLLALNADSEECLRLGPLAACAVTTYGVAPDAAWRIVERGESPGAADDGRFRQRFDVVHGGQTHEIELSVPGAHNRANATAALVLALAAGAPAAACIAACAEFRGASRRFEIAGRVAGVTVIDDYAHHPTAVEVTVRAARGRAGAGRVIALYVPHTYSRTRALLQEHAHVFEGADIVRIGPIEAARERRLAPTASHLEVVEVARPHVADIAAVDSPDAAAREIAGIARPGDLVVVLSLGGFDHVAGRIVEALEDLYGKDAAEDSAT